MRLSSLAVRQIEPPRSATASSSTLAVVTPASSRLATSLSASTAAPSIQVTTVTVLEVVYLAAAATETSHTTSSSSAAGADSSNLASIATDSYDGLSFVQLGAAFSTALVVVLVVSCFAAFFLRQAGQMRRLMEVTDEEELSEVGLGDAGRRTGKRSSLRGGRKGERRGLMALLCLAWLPLAAHAQDDAEEAPATTLENMPTLTSSKTAEEVQTVPAQMGAGARGAQAYQEQQSFTSSLESALSSVEATMTAAAPWATSTTGMQPYKDEDDTVVVHSDGGITYACPNKGDEWVVEDLTDSLSAHTATGAGCYMSYSSVRFAVDDLTRRSVRADDVPRADGATGTDGGVFGCSVSASNRNYTGWFNAFGASNTYKPFQGSCAMQGLGWDDHTVQLVNSPYQPGKVWFTGLRYSTNKTEIPWETHSWDACCAAYTFPEGVATTIESKPSATGSSGATVAGMSSGTALFVVCGLGAVVVLASLLVAMMCCKKRPTAGTAGTKQALRSALDSDSDDSEESQPLHGKNRSLGRRRHSDDESRTSGSRSSRSGSGTESSSSESEEKKHRKRKRHSG
ncbi:hypothetical protein JCM9279_003453 [Rhodotorula babjevae]